MLLSPSGVTLIASSTFLAVQSPPSSRGGAVGRRRGLDQRGRGLDGAGRIAGLAHGVEALELRVLLRERASARMFAVAW